MPIPSLNHAIVHNGIHSTRHDKEIPGVEYNAPVYGGSFCINAGGAIIVISIHLK